VLGCQEKVIVIIHPRKDGSLEPFLLCCELCGDTFFLFHLELFLSLKLPQILNLITKRPRDLNKNV